MTISNEELQRLVDRADSDEFDPFDGIDPYFAARLARRVLAAEKLVEDIKKVRDETSRARGEQSHRDACRFSARRLTSALTAYKEASK